MKWIAKTKNGVLEFNSVKVCTESQFNKLGAGINRQRIIAWCDDNHISFEIQRGEQCMSIIREVVQEINEAEARRIDILHDKFLEFIDELPETNEPKNADEPDLKPATVFVRDILTGIHNCEIKGALVMQEIGPFEMPWGRISLKTLTEMCELYLDKHENKGN